MSIPDELLDARRPRAPPCLILALDRVRENVATVRRSFGPLNPRIFYSVKASPEPDVLAVLGELGCGFDVASIGEINWLEQGGLSGHDVCFSSTVKVPEHIEEPYKRGIDKYAFDSPDEVLKLARLAPGSKLILRLDVPHMGSRWPLAGKFRAPPKEAGGPFKLARQHGLEPYGLTFHVGSQCVRPDTWLEALAVCGRVWNQARGDGIHLKSVNLGGGLPATY